MTTELPISADFPFNPHYVEVLGSRMQYVDEGSGDPILFLHGNPTSSYLWRNIIPHLSSLGRCIAPDLIGMGRSEKPPLAYRFSDHVRYVEGFIDALNLKHITLVIHDWGSALGFHYAMRHPHNIRGLAFMEALMRPFEWDDFPPDFKMGFKLMRTPLVGWLMVSVMNVFVKQILPSATVRKLTPAEMAHYAAPFKTIASRKPVRQWPCEIPIAGKPTDVHQAISDYNQKLQASEIPKLLFYANPGGTVNQKTLAWCQESLKNLKSVNIGQGIHYLQEDQPHLIGAELATWFKSIK